MDQMTLLKQPFTAENAESAEPKISKSAPNMPLFAQQAKISAFSARSVVK